MNVFFTRMKDLRYIILLILIPFASAALPLDLRFRNINAGDGLSNNEINAIFKDSEGYIWIGSASGLNRYDGNDIRVFRHNPGDSTSIFNNYVEEVFEDSDHRLWVRTAGIYSCFDPLKESFSKLSTKTLSDWNIKGYPNIVRASGSDLWIATNGIALYRIHLSAADTKAVKMLSVPSPKVNFTDVLPVAQQKITIAVSDCGELFIIDYNNGQVLNSTKVPGAQGRKTGYSLMLDNTGSVWIHSDGGTHIFDLNSASWRNAPVSPEKLPVRTLACDRQGNIWIGYDNDGIEILSPDGDKTVVTNNPVDIFSLANNSIRAFFTDEDDGIWIGTYKRGVSVFYANEFQLDTRYIADINCVCPVEDMPDCVWLGSDHEGLIRYNIATGQISHIPSDKSSAIVCLAYDNDGALWYGTYRGGLYRYKNGALQHFGTDDGIASSNIWAILPNSNGTLWLGTLGGGVQLYDPVSKTAETFNASNSILDNDYISTLVRTPDGRILVGSSDVIYSLSPATHKITTDRLGNLNRNHRKLSAINQLYIDSRNLLWIAARDGLECYDSRTDSLYTIPLGPHAASNMVLGVIEASDRSVWASSDASLFNIVISKAANGSYSFKTVTYDSRDGIGTESFNQRSFSILHSGQVVAGTHNGIAIIQPAKISDIINAYRILFTALSVNNQPVSVGESVDGNIVLPVAINHLNQLKLRPSQNSFTISFSSDNYSRLSRVHYRYRLVEYDRNWIECPPGQNRASFSNIPPGKYTLEVGTIGDDGAPSGAVRSLPVIIATPWWATWWAKMAYVILVLGICTLAVLWVRHSERERFAKKKHEDAKRKEEELNQLKFKFFTNISHELRTPLTLILSPAESMLKEVSDARDVRRLSTIRDNANRLLYLVNQLLDFRKNEMSELKLHLSKGDLVTTVSQACRSFLDMTERRRQRLEVVADIPVMEMEYDNDKITKTILNLLSNAVKYTPEEGTIEVRVFREGEYAVIEVRDSGSGISDTDKQHIFERFYRSQDTSDLNTGSGIGLSMVYEYVRLHKGEVSVEDNHPCGTVFRVRIPATLAAESKSKALDDKPAEASAPASSREKSLPARPTVLFVDDNIDLIDFLRDDFSRDYDVFTACNGVEALKLTEDHKFNLIVSDIMMPEMDGIHLCRALKSKPSTVDVPLILLTAKQDVGSVIEGLTLGADDYITKPFNNEVLRLRMRHLIALNGRGLRHSLIEPSPKEIKITSVDEQFVAKAVDYVEKNMAKSDLTVEEMAAALGMSRVHLYKRLSALTGRTPVEFIRILRLKRATQYLTDNHITIAEIAYKVGFNNPKYFSKHFRDEFGISPAEYQAKESRRDTD